ncbi:LytTR family DNA-binding domain-containing protein [Salinibacterium sp.]|uniref:LytR/AlgR family response regulator transcription factor n=1 Tax=Salinibacterium sp. TaxID=1915057 RepID=UPI00286A1248|nr:LytTR family DNA-binding domain-containing protein [Salinibacterium sp.]
MIDVLIADDEEPALEALEFLLRRDPRIALIRRANTSAGALQILTSEKVDAALLDIHMPGLSGFDLARAINRFASPPVIVFVTADEETAVDAFDLDATDYLLKPVRQDRLARAVSRIEAALAPGVPAKQDDEVITVIRGATIRRIRRSDVRYVQAQGDYARLHTDDDSYIVRIPITDLCEQWSGSGFLRVHRSFLVALASVTSVRVGSNPVVTVGGVDLPVSRRLLPAVRDAFEARGGRP